MISVAREMTEPAEQGYRRFPAGSLNRDISPQKLAELYPSATSVYSAQAARNMDVDIRERVSGGEDLETVVKDIVDSTDAPVIANLPDGYRNKLLMILDHDAENLPGIRETRLKIETGQTPAQLAHLGPIKGAAIGFSADLIDWMDEKKIELDGAISDMYDDNPDLKAIKDTWDTASVDDRIKVMEELHKVHADVYGYDPSDMYVSDKRNTLASYEAASDKIRIHPDILASTDYRTAEEIVLHESDHAFLDFVSRHPGLDSIAARELSIRLSSYRTSLGLKGDGYLGAQNQYTYMSDPGETHAYLLHGDDYTGRTDHNDIFAARNAGLRETAFAKRAQREAFHDQVRTLPADRTQAIPNPVREDFR